MGLVYVDPAVWYNFPVDTQTIAINHIKTILEAAGWTTASSVKASITGTFTACINTNLATVDATSAAGVVTVTGATGGPSGNGIAVSEGLSNFTWANARLTSGGYVLNSGIDPKGKQFALYVNGYDDSGDHIRLQTRSVSGDLIEVDIIGPAPSLGGHKLGFAAATRLQCIAHPHGYVFYRTGSLAANTVAIAQMIWQGDAEAGVLITAATNATPIELTTATAHGMTTGQQAYVANVGGNTAANGLWTVTVTGGSSLKLDTSVGNGAYISGGALASVTGGQVSRCWFADGSTPFRDSTSLRLDISGDGGSGHRFVVTNQNAFMQNGGSKEGRPRLLTLGCWLGHGGGADLDLKNEGGRYIVTEAIMRWHSTDENGKGRVQGAWYNAAYTTAVLPMDEEFHTPDGKHWITFSDSDNEGTLLLRIPATITTL